jgi:hypothetical protein
MAFRTKKISQMDPKGSNLASTDLLEISQLVSGSYVTKSITGAEIVASVPPSVTAWGTITGTLSTQTDLNTALNGKVPTTRTLTINGTTQDLSADRTFTISTGITIGTTAITSGTNGRFLFDDGGVVSETNGAFWDKVNGRFGLGTSSPSVKLDIIGTGELTRFGSSLNYWAFSSLYSPVDNKLEMVNQGGIYYRTKLVNNTYDTRLLIGDYQSFLSFGSYSNQQRLTIRDNGNVLIGTTTDAGFKLDVNGTARVNGNNTIIGFSSASQLSFRFGVVSNQGVSTRSGDFTIGLSDSTSISGGRFYNNGTGYLWIDGFTEGASKAQNYPVIIGSRAAATGSSVGSYTTEENGSQTYFGFFAAQPSAQVIINSTTRGFLPPRMTTTQKNAIATPATGLMVYDTTLNKLCVRTASAWETITSL